MKVDSPSPRPPAPSPRPPAPGPPTTVVNVRKDTFDVYIGRKWRAEEDQCVGPNCVESLPESVYANPFPLWKYSQRDRVVELYEELWRQRLGGKSRALWLGRLRDLKGKRLGCWCAPLACHGHVLVKLIEEFCP